MHEILKEYNEKLNLWVLRCPDGCKITSWNVGDDILDYSSFVIAYCPKDADLTVYHCVSAEDDEKYMEEQRIKVIEMEKGGN